MARATVECIAPPSRPHEWLEDVRIPLPCSSASRLVGSGAAAEVGDPDLHVRVERWSRLFRDRQ